MEIRKVVLVLENGEKIDITEMFINRLKNGKMGLYELADYILEKTDGAIDIEFE